MKLTLYNFFSKNIINNALLFSINIQNTDLTNKILKKSFLMGFVNPGEHFIYINAYKGQEIYYQPSLILIRYIAVVFSFVSTSTLTL